MSGKRIPLVSAAYAGKSIISSGQEAVNLYAETVPDLDPQAPTPTTYYLTPGTILFGQNTEYVFPARGCYCTSRGTVYYVVGQNVYFVTDDGTLTSIGIIADRASQVKMKDNGLVVILVDGVNGYVIDMVTNKFAQILDVSFYGADYVELLDTFFVFNRPNTNQFYISSSNADFASLTNSSINSGTVSAVGAGYTDGTYSNVPLTGGTGTGATANVVVGGTGAKTGTIAGGTTYTNGTYNNVALSGGAGTGARANITVAGGIVTAVALINAGTGYAVGNVLTTAAANIGGTGSGFTFTLTAIGGDVITFTIGNPGTGYAIGDTLSFNASDAGGTGTGFSWIVNSTGSAFDPLDVAAKAGFNDPIVGITATHRQLQLIGNRTSEVWIGTGAADFYFQQVQGAFINHGCSAQYSIASQDILTFFVQQDTQGNGLVVSLKDYEISEISTPRIVSEFKNYPTLDDAIGFCYQIEDHAFYELVFPTANKGWLYDLKTGQWSEKNWCDANGNLLRPRENCAIFAFNKILVGDWESGNLLHLNKDVYTDYSNDNNSSPIVRIRTFPHIIDDNSRVSISSFDADMEVGTIEDQEDDPMISIALSYDKGRTYSNPVYQSLGKTGDYLAVPSWNRLGQGRDIVIKLQWDANCKTALNGGFVTRKKART